MSSEGWVLIDGQPLVAPAVTADDFLEAAADAVDLGQVDRLMDAFEQWVEEEQPGRVPAQAVLDAIRRAAERLEGRARSKARYGGPTEYAERGRRRIEYGQPTKIERIT